ncbi:MAG: PAS domain-containing protein [Patescibacteria group bacterium]|nr:PAS domain-containing protein [Patescibacteria group bacterium]
MSLGQNRKIALTVVLIFTVSLTSVLLILGKDYFPISSNSLKADILGTISSHETEGTYRNFIGNTEDPIFAIESDGTFSYISPGLEAKLGYKPGALNGQLFFSLISEKDLPEVVTGFTEFLQTGETFHSGGPFRIVKKDGSKVYVLIDMVPLKDDHGNIVRMIGSFKDITDSVEEFKTDDEKVIRDDSPKIRDTETEGEENKDSRLLVEKLS